MIFLNDLWKKFKIPISHDKKREGPVLEKSREPYQSYPILSKSLEQQENLLNTYQEIETEDLQRETTIENLKILKELIDEPKEEMPELRFSKIKQHLDNPESYETVRQERWPENITCPNCKSKNLKRLPSLPDQSSYNHRYRCLVCAHEFDDESGTPFGAGVPPLNIWMQCWYLMGCTDSLSYIAARLNLDISIVERMAEQLRKIFNANKPLTRFLNFEEWNKQSTDLCKRLSDDLIKQYECLNANIATTPKDTTEFRRQQNLRRTLTPTIEPPTNTPSKKRKR